jgi:hypothetical protein
MKHRAILLMLLTSGLLTGCSQSGESGSENAKHYRNPNEGKKADDTQTTKHQPGMSPNDSKAQDQKSGSNNPPPR